MRTRLLGKRAIALHGPAAGRFFYEAHHIHRHSALPEPVIDTLFARGAVHTLDGKRHRSHKSLFMHLLTGPDRVASLAAHVAREWERAVATGRTPGAWSSSTRSRSC
ncbi:hypothetical protein [Streptomyces brevispora]|uniref:Cytochrome P450 n=1 Tax=Streptomyces brevispora TaxID=887462 RepID=A0ABZ1FWC9_9ACTN|nr:hypothetical protein [Streptomyces brevispora]WSC11805.1 hypothetical protein OIE64_02290 [Streptomyces brevispora]